jgi:methylmalonyl-CoA mutase
VIPVSDADELREQWLTSVEKVLGGRSFDEVLTTRTRGGVVIEPLYTRDNTTVPEPPPPGTGNQVRGPFDPDRLSRGWDIRQHHSGGDPDQVATALIEDLQRGVTSIELSPPDGGWGTDGLARSLDGVCLDLVPVHLAPHTTLEAARDLVELWDHAGLGAETRGGLGLDPIGEWGRSGADPKRALAECARFVVERLGERPLVRGLVADVERYVDAGADEVEELAWGTATAVAYLRALTDAGLDVEQAASRIGFRWTATAEQFVTIAKLRAARRMWARVLEASGSAEVARDQNQQAVTPLSLYSRLDPWVNLIRGTIATLAAVVGGADSVTVRPFDALSGGLVARAGGPASTLGRRTARNTQILLREESHLGRSIDPGGGSWFVETLTDELAAMAWNRFRDIERDGGMVDRVASGALSGELDASWSARLVALGTRRESLTGVNQFPHLEDSGLEPTPSAEPTNEGGRGGLPLRRPADPFERLRDAADRHHAETGDRPTVHIAALGPRATHQPRSTWAINLLAVGGIAATGGEADGAESPIATEASFCATGACVAVITGSDELYSTRGEAAALALTDAGAELVVVVGEPGDQGDRLTSAGVAEFWYEGIDVLETLRRLHAVLGIAPS